MASRGGAALVAVLLALALTSALVVGGSYVARQSATASGIARRGAELEARAEEALVRAVMGWDTAARLAQPVGVTDELVRLDAPGVSVRLSATRVEAGTWWLVAEASGTAKPLLRRHLGLLVHADSSGATPLSRRAWLDLP